MSFSTRTVVVVGGGIAGATVAGKLDSLGWCVHLVEKADDIGGYAAQWGCKATDVCVRCNVCVADSVFRAVRSSPGITIHRKTILLDAVPGNGRYVVKLAPSGSPPGIRDSAVSEVEADAVVIATGYKPYDPAENELYGYGRIPDVITGVDAERMLAEGSGLCRPSNGASPSRVAFVQCVGSRTEEIFRRPEDADYCSTVCCAYGLRTAAHILHRNPESEITVFYMDIQEFGCGFRGFYEDCRSKMKFVRSRPFEMTAGADGAVNVKYAVSPGGSTEGAVATAEFDMVVLCVGIRPSDDTMDLAERLRLSVNEQGFVSRNRRSPVGSSGRPAIYSVGACERPGDIASCMAGAESVSARLVADLAGGDS